MASKKESSSFNRRLADIAAHFEESMRPGPAKAPKQPKSGLSEVFGNLRELFTQGVTGEDLKDLVRRDARDAFHFYTREIDFAALRALPWYRRCPAMAWKVFLALAHRLTPARRIAFVAATLFFLLGWIQFLTFNAGSAQDPRSSGALFLFLAFALWVPLLLMELRDKLDLKRDLEIAREIQFGLVPAGPLHRNSVSIHCFMRPANTVGGDYYDMIDLDGDRIAAVVADVAGKGMPAALLMALLQGSLRTLLAAGHRGADLMTKLNVYLWSSIPDNSLITLFYGELDTRTGDLFYVNAGHNAPILLRQAAPLERLPATALVLGIDPESSFESGQVRIDSGERLLLYTDGISEAFNPKEEEYGEERVVAFLQAHTGMASAELIQELVKDVLRFCGAERVRDDMTLMVIARETTAGDAPHSNPICGG